jgi:hypothetical protein
VWAKTGEISYRRLNEFRVVETRIDGGFSASAPLVLFELAVPYGDEQSRTWDVTVTGQRILAVHVPEEAGPRRIEIVKKFFGELRRLAPNR